MLFSRNNNRRSRGRVAALGLALLLAATPGRAGEYLVQVWGVDEGLPQSSVTDLKQTPDGYLWIGTLLGGLARFDGQRFVSFNPENTPALINAGVRRLLLDFQGVLWVNDYGGNLISLQDGVFVRHEVHDVQLGSLVLERQGLRVFAALDGEILQGRQAAGQAAWTWERFKPAQGGAGPYYVSDANGALWYRHPGSRLGRFAEGRFAAVELPEPFRGRQLQTLAQGENETVWVGTDRELAVWNGREFRIIVPANGETNLLVQSVVPVPEGRVWVQANNRLRLLDGDRWVAEVAEWDGRRAPWSRLRIMRSDEAGGLWISLREEGLVHVRPDGTLARITSAEGLPSQLVQAFQPDAQGNLWTGYHRGGLVRVRHSLFRSVGRAEGLLDTVVLSVTEDARGALWIGTASGAVARWQDGTLTNFTLPLRGTFCQEAVVSADRAGRVWVGTTGNGLLVGQEEEFRHVLTPAELPQGVRSLLARRDGSVWYANFGGLYRMQNGRPERMLEFRRTDDVAGSLAEGPDGTLWMGTLGGALLRLREGQWERFTTTDAHPPSRFWSLLPESAERVWVGTLDQGVLLFDNGRFNRFTVADGLADDGVSQILSDGEDLWLGTRLGVSRVSRATLLRRAAGKGGGMVNRVFGRGAGLLTTAMALEFTPNCVRGADGKLWFSSAKGVAWTRPEDVGRRQPAPPVIIEEVLADGRALAKQDWKPATLRRGNGLRLGPGLRNLEIHYTAPDLTAPELVKFRYRLEDVDSEWQEVGTRRSITFPRLPPGNYTFRLSACNSDGVWSSEGAALQLTIVPQFYERRSVQAGVALFVGGAALGLMRLITKRRMQRKLDRLERQKTLEQERTRIAQDLHDELGAGLTEISLTSDLAANPELEPTASVRFVQEIGSKARELVSAMDEIVWAVNPRNDSVPSLAAYFCQYAQRVLGPAGVRCRLDVDDALPAAPLNLEQRHQLFLAFKEALTNVIRHAGAEEVQVGIHAEAGRLVVSLTDDGRGLGAEPPSAGSDGLANMRARLARLGGECFIGPGPQRGTRVEFRAPLPVGEL